MEDLLIKKPQAHVLVVDDDPTIRVIMEKALTKVGFHVTLARDGVEALNLYLETPPDLVISDVQMPEKNGLELCADIRARESGRFKPILMMTGADDDSSVEKAFRAGATDFITKPVNHAILIHRVRYMLRASENFIEWKKTEGLLSRLGRALDSSSSEIFFLDSESLCFIEASKVMLKNTGYSKKELFSLPVVDLFTCDEKSPSLFGDQLSSLLNGGSKQLHCEGDMLRKDGSCYPVEGHAYLARESYSDKVDIVCIFEDMTQRRQAEEQMRKLAYYDSLTNLPNRELFVKNFNTALALGKRHNYQVALLFIDLDNFKDVNDSMGHGAGDELLQVIAKIIQGCVRSSDIVGFCSDQSVARFGGDEFAVLLSQVDGEEGVELVADRILKAMSNPFNIQNHEFLVTPSIGVVISPTHGDDVDLLLRKADIAMYEAKKQGRNRYQIYSDSIYARSLEKMDLENDLRNAIGSGELLLHYQPKYEIATKTLCGFEALLRWNRKGRNFVSPMEFIPLAEEMGLILDIGDWVIRETCRQIRQWKDQGVSDVFPVAVNLSSKQVQGGPLVKEVTDALAAYDLSPDCLEFEITETMMMENMDVALEVLKELKAMGCKIHLDDFGTGYSSLNYLSQFPLDVLKIDKSFVNRINVDEDSNSIITAIIAMAKSLGLKVVAEGVETEEQLDFIKSYQVDYLQGYLWCKPLPVSEVERQIFKLNSSMSTEVSYV